MCGCSTKAAGNDQVLTVGLSSEMNGTFSPMYYKRQMILMWWFSVSRVIEIQQKRRISCGFG